MSKFIKITAEQFKNAVTFLWDKQGGCFHLPFFFDGEKSREWCFVIGWSDGYDTDPDPGYYQPKDEPSYRIAAGIRYQGEDNGMQTDMDIDFLIPAFPDGDCYDLSFAVPKDSDFSALATRLNEYAKTAMKLLKEFD